MHYHEGKLYARVSDVIDKFKNFSRIPEKVLHAKAALGTRVHELIHIEVKGDKLPEVPLELAGYLESFHKWRSMMSPVFLETEVRHYCDKEMLTGCIDALVQLEGYDKAVLIDFKTSAQECSVTWPMQAHLYHYLFSSGGKPISDRILFLKLDKNGALPTVFQYKVDINLLTRCLQAVRDFWKINLDNNWV